MEVWRGTVCEARGNHGLGVMTEECEKVYKITCPDCGFWVLITDDELLEEVTKALSDLGYRDIEIL